MNEKFMSVAFVPFVTYKGVIRFFLQKRDAVAPVNPSRIDFFGGGMEPGETPEEAVVREVREELDFTLDGPQFFSRYETAKGIMYVYVREVEDSFESSVTVLEGERGLFVAEAEVPQNRLIVERARYVLSELAEHLHQS